MYYIIIISRYLCTYVRNETIKIKFKKNNNRKNHLQTSLNIEILTSGTLLAFAHKNHTHMQSKKKHTIVSGAQHKMHVDIHVTKKEQSERCFNSMSYVKLLRCHGAFL